ncbi:hypothetical protein ACFQ1I_28050 [Kitasatospora arboriphila]
MGPGRPRAGAGRGRSPAERVRTGGPGYGPGQAHAVRPREAARAGGDDRLRAHRPGRGGGALVLLPEYFPAARTLTVSTAVVSALLAGLIARFTLNEQAPGVSLALSAVCSVLLVSVLARPDLVDRTGGQHPGRHRPA